jgi:ATP-dependent DNA helicase PIF1
MSWVITIILVIYIMSEAFKKSGSSGYQNKQTQYRRPSAAHTKKLNEERILIEKVTLSEEQKRIFDKIENSKDHFFITGKAGTGKSILLQYLKHKSQKRLVVGAFTGVAALNVGGQTLNSLFQLPIGFIDVSRLRVGNRVAMLMRHIDMVVIDEISMVRADMMDAIDTVLRQARGNQAPFGGVQMVLFGDPYQLPPVTPDEALHEYFAHNHGGQYFFNAHAWKKTKLHTYELNHIFRQEKDEEFKFILNAVRKNELEDSVLFGLNDKCVRPVPEEGVITLATRNAVVDRINTERLNQINEPEQVYRAEIIGNLERSSYPAEEFLKLRKGAQVMLLKNDPEKRWVNGTVGVVESLSQTEIKVRINGEIVYSIPKATWNKIRYFYNQQTRKVEEEILSSFTQYPLRLAWAFTIHKSQGKTYNSVVVNMEGGAFAHGQAYVALSRCTSLAGLYLTQPLERDDIKVDPVVINFMEKINIEIPEIEVLIDEKIPATS